MNTLPPPPSEPQKALRFAINLSLAIGFIMLVVKVLAAALTHSAAILSDAAESVVHVVAVGFASYSLRLSLRRSDATHPFGYDRISFFSAGFEGAMIILAALYILFEATRKFLEGPHLQEIGLGTGVEALVLVVNGLLGFFLIRRGKKKASLILEANGRHVLTDSVTSAGVLIGLLLVIFAKNPWFDSAYFDPIFAVLAALNILKEGISLIFRAVSGLMDSISPAEEKRIEALLENECRKYGIGYHQTRFRNSGTRYWFQFHLIFDDSIALREAHKIATEIEKVLEGAFPGSVTTTHLETGGDHGEVHSPLDPNNA